MKTKIFGAIMLIILAGVLTSEKTELISKIPQITAKDSILSILPLFNTFIIFILLALIIEVACEVLVSILTMMKALQPDPEDTPTATDDQKALATKQRKSFATMLCIALGLFIAINGFLFMQMTMQTLTQAFPINQMQTWRHVDIIVTALVLAGGADGIHQIWKYIKPLLTDS